MEEKGGLKARQCESASLFRTRLRSVFNCRGQRGLRQRGQGEQAKLLLETPRDVVVARAEENGNA